MGTLKIGLVQQPCGTDRDENLRQSVSGIHACAVQGAELVVLQELHNNIYFCQAEDTDKFALAEPVPGHTTNLLAATAREAGVVVVASVFERRAPGLCHNTAVVLETDGSIAGKYRKMHIPDDPAYYEKFYFTPGDLGFQPIQTSVGLLGVLVCWDQWYPEGARLMAMAGAELLIYPTAIGWDPADSPAEKERQFNAWVISQRAHAVANGLPVVSVNRTGHEPDFAGVGRGIDFWGHSFVCGPQGEFLAKAPHDGPMNLVAEIDLGRTEEVRRIWPFFRDRRIDAYGGLTQRYLL